MQAYSSWARSMTSIHVPMTSLLQTLPYVSIPLRKVLLSMTRIQRYPTSGSRIYQRYTDEWNTDITIIDPSGTITIGTHSLKYMVGLISDIQLSPTFSGFLSSCIRSAPYHDYTSADITRISGIHKEIAASIEVSQKGKVDYRPILSEEPDFRTQVFEGLEISEEVSKELHTCFLQARNHMRGKVLYPKISKKTVGPDTVQNIEQQVRAMDYDVRLEEIPASIQLVERIYHLSGYEVQGPAEMRCAWKYSQIKPRVYFAQGGDVYPYTKYVQAFFNEVMQFFPVVHPTSRFNPPDEPLQTSDLLIIYDLASFTSKLDEIRNFVESLASFFSGVEITVMDSYHGPLQIDLGEMLRRYNQEANNYAKCDITKVMELVEQTCICHTCGMLGVPGNISSCTLLHGIFTCYVVKSTRKCRCVGDDAKLYWYGWHLKDLECDISTFGEVSVEKMESWGPDDGASLDKAWNYTKRPINRLPRNVVTIGQLVIFPTLDTILGLPDDHYHLYIPQKETPPARANRFSAQWNRLLKTLWSNLVSLTDIDREILFHFQMSGAHNLQLFGCGSVSKRIDGVFVRVPLLVQKDEFGMDPDKLVLDKFDLVTEHEFPEYDPIFYRPFGFQGEVFKSCSSKCISMLEDLGYFDKELSVGYYARGVVGDRFFLLLYNGQYSNCYRYTIRFDLPSWSTAYIPDNRLDQ